MYKYVYYLKINKKHQKKKKTTYHKKYRFFKIQEKQNKLSKHHKMKSKISTHEQKEQRRDHKKILWHRHHQILMNIQM